MLKAGSACMIPHTSYMHVFIKSSQPSFPPFPFSELSPSLIPVAVFLHNSTL